MSSFAFIIKCVNFQLKLSSAKFLLFINSLLRLFYNWFFFCLKYYVEPSGLFHVASGRELVRWGRTNFIHCSYRKCGTHARFFSRTLAHGNSKIEIRHINRGRRHEEENEYRRKYNWHEKMKSRRSNYPKSSRSHHVSHSRAQSRSHHASHSWQSFFPSQVLLRLRGYSM